MVACSASAALLKYCSLPVCIAAEVIRCSGASRMQSSVSETGIYLQLSWQREHSWQTASDGCPALQLLVSSFNASAAEGVMCRGTVSVGWDGRIYDCDFNHQLEMGLR